MYRFPDGNVSVSRFPSTWYSAASSGPCRERIGSVALPGRTWICTHCVKTTRLPSATQGPVFPFESSCGVFDSLNRTFAE